MGGARRNAALGFMLGALVVLSACGAAATGDAGTLTGDWGLIESSVSSVDLGAAGITATFDGERVSGFSGVNQYGGPYTAKKSGSFKVGDVSSTLMAGPESLMNAEKAYLELLKACDSFRVQSGKLTLSTGAQESLIYEQAKQAELPGTKWVVTGYNNGKQTVVSPSLGSTPTIGFGTDGTVSGETGVNNFRGPSESTGATVSIGPLATTRMVGPEELMNQETALIGALQNSTTWSISRGRLEMRDAEGAVQITASAP